MRILVTAGNTQTPIDQVRCLTNVFTGRTGGRIAVEAHRRGHDVTLLTSHPEAVASPRAPDGRWRIEPYRTFDDLATSMARLIPSGGLDCIVHCAAVSDYALAGTYVANPGTHFNPDGHAWHGEGGPPSLQDVTTGKVKSSHSELWLRLLPTPKLVDRIRSAWGFRGVLVKFKLEVDVSDEALLATAEASRTQSSADLIVANTLEGMATWAFLGPIDGKYERIDRAMLATRLLDAVAKFSGPRRR